MLMLAKNKRGFGAVEALIVFVVLCSIAAIGVCAWNRMNADEQATPVNTNRANDQPAGTPVTWRFDDAQQRYVASGTPPACPSPLFAISPVDTTRATSVLYPGQYRGMNYKPHGGFAFDTSSASDIQVVMPMDGTLTGLTRYIEPDEIQYKVSFTHPCGITFYFDHLYALSPELMAVAETTPKPKVDDTRGVPLTNGIDLKAGALVASTIGHPKTGNMGIDFGVLDLRSPNTISQNPTWAALHKQFNASEWFGICWFDELPAADAARTKALPSRDFKSGVRSDYCPNNLGTTLDVNGGQPL